MRPYAGYFYFGRNHGCNTQWLENLSKSLILQHLCERSELEIVFCLQNGASFGKSAVELGKLWQIKTKKMARKFKCLKRYLNFGAKNLFAVLSIFDQNSNETFMVVFQRNQLLEAFLIRFPYVFFSKLDVSHETDTLGMGNPIATHAHLLPA